MPIQWLLLESDAPDQPGAAHLGQRNEPAFMCETLRFIAKLRGQSEEIIAATDAGQYRASVPDQTETKPAS